MKRLMLTAAAVALGACVTEGTTPTTAMAMQDAQPASAQARGASERYSDECITEQEVVEAQQAWGDGIVRIGEVYQANGDYRAAAADHINEHYGYDLSLVLFKPTLASVDQFRASFDGALSYFVGSNPSYPEDKGFAINPWSAVRWENAGITNNSCTMAVAMGNYFFTPVDGGEETKVEYTIGYVKDQAGDLRMVVHKSSLPYQGPADTVTDS